MIVHRSRFCAMWTDNRGRWLAVAIARRVCVAGKVVPGADRILEGIRAQESGIRAVQIPEESGSGNQESRRVDTGAGDPDVVSHPDRSRLVPVASTALGPEA